MSIHYLNNSWVTDKQLTISAFDLSVLRGFGIFDFLRTYGNRPFRLDDHISRLFNSARLLGITVPKSEQEIKKIIRLGIEKNNYPETEARIVVTGGISDDSITPGKSSFIVIFKKAHKYPANCYSKGIKLITHHFIRPYPLAKSLNYLTAVLVKQEATKAGATEVLYTDNHDFIYECTTSNFFAVVDGTLITPIDSVLQGVTRTVVIELAKELGIATVERAVSMKDINKFQEAFITATNKEIMPVHTIDTIKIPILKQGITQKLMKAFEKVKQDTKTS